MAAGERDSRQLGNPVNDELLTRAVRDKSLDAFRAALLRMIVENESEWLKDDRDFMLALAPYHDCARRLGLDPGSEFASAAEQSPDGLAETVRVFGSRTDVTPSSFYYALVETQEGPTYHWVKW